MLMSILPFPGVADKHRLSASDPWDAVALIGKAVSLIGVLPN
jgi:hypothetical protein